MNKQELIKSISHLPSDCSGPLPMINKLAVLKFIKLLDEPQKVTVPKFVADFITEQKKLGHTLSYSIDACMSDRIAEWYWDNSELFAQTWIFGYTVVEEKRYLVKLKGVIDGTKVLKHDLNDDAWYMGISFEYKDLKDNHTKEELEAGGFGEVFNSPLFEVEEAE